MGKTIEMKGLKFGRLTVTGFVGYDCNSAAIWRCRCECGKEVIVTGSSLRGGYTKSCGCLSKERVAERNRARAKKKVVEQDTAAVDRARRREEQEEEMRQAMQRPIDKSKFDDWWMFGDHEAENQRWFEYFIR